jgi:hypothetical protein
MSVRRARMTLFVAIAFIVRCAKFPIAVSRFG